MFILFKAILGFLKLKFCQQFNPQPISAILNNLQNHNWKNASDSLWIWKGRRGSLSKNNRCQRYTALDFGVVICVCVSTEGRVSLMVHWHPPAKPKDSQGLLPPPEHRRLPLYTVRLNIFQYAGNGVRILPSWNWPSRSKKDSIHYQVWIIWACLYVVLPL